MTTLDGGRYRLEGVVGRGGMALVYRAVDREHDEPVAIKLLADNLAADPELRQRFAREAALAGRLSHPNVVRVLGSGEADGRAFIVLEYVDGRDLAEELRRERAARARRASPSSAPRPPPRSRTRTSAASSTATSSPRTSSSRVTGR